MFVHFISQRVIKMSSMMAGLTGFPIGGGSGRLSMGRLLQHGSDERRSVSMGGLTRDDGDERTGRRQRSMLGGHQGATAT